MPFSVKAQEILDYLLNHTLVDEYISVAKDYIERKGQYEPGPPFSMNVPSLAERLKSDLGNAVQDASDSDWRDVADWLLRRAMPR